MVRFPIDIPAPGSRPFDVVGLGLNTTDLLAVIADHPRPGSKQSIERLAYLPGGQAATAMTTCSRLGWSARYVGRFGDDPNGAGGLAALRAAGVDVTTCKTVTGATNALSLILVDASTGQRTILWSRHPGLEMAAGDVPADAVCSGRVLLLDCHDTAAATAAARYARAAGIPTVIDVECVRPGVEELLTHIDMIITSQEFPVEFTGITDLGAALRELNMAYRPAMTCATLGPEGSLALVGETEIRTAGFEVSVIDTTGAGDVFRGGFIAGWLLAGSAPNVEQVLIYANAVAALKCRKLGARAGIPNRVEVETILRRSCM